MATISSANLQTLADNIAKALVDLETAYITNHTSNAPTVNTVTTGVQNLSSRVAGLADLSQESALGSATLSDVANVIAYMTIPNSTFYYLYRDVLSALETHVSGLNAFLTTNTVMVHPEFAAAFNYMAKNAVGLGLRSIAPTQIAIANIFLPATQTLATLAITGATTGTYAAGTPIDTTKYAPQTLLIQNTSAGALAAGEAFTVTYVNAAGQTVNTNFTVAGGGLAANATATLGVTGSVVSNIVVTSGGVAAQSVAVIAQPARTVAY